jgi:sugar phosphate isomerase/epimerase
VDGTNLTNVSDQQFEIIARTLSEAAVRVNCFGSAVGNWAKKISDPPDSSYEELARAIPRMHKLGTKLIRIMSFALPKPIPLSDKAMAAEAIKRLMHLTKMAEDGGVILAHENCAGWAGQSYEHTLYLLEKVKSDALKLVFDTGNPVGDPDVRGNGPYAKQNAWDFYRQVREHIIYVHIKDGRMIDDKLVYRFPAEGDGFVTEICADLHAHGYDGGLSMEPHLAAVAHDPGKKPTAQDQYNTFIEYGKRFEKILASLEWKTTK